MGFYIFIAAVILISFWVIKTVRKRKASEKEYGATESYTCVHMYGVPHLSESSLTSIFITSENLIIESGNRKFHLPMDSLTAAEFLTKTDLLKKDKTVIGRGIVGGLVLGPLGAIVGGMSGIGQKHNKGNYLVLNYRSSDNEEIKVIIFDIKNIIYAQKLAKKLTERIIYRSSKDGIIQL